ncbi:Uncharacterised protein [Mycobacteroides abscessus subsp. abscessus]|nr:Uncharacterised protein [Mycobacteroides abscessus subsp. abscessus]
MLRTPITCVVGIPISGDHTLAITSEDAEMTQVLTPWACRVAMRSLTCG